MFHNKITVEKPTFQADEEIFGDGDPSPVRFYHKNLVFLWILSLFPKVGNPQRETSKGASYPQQEENST